MIPVLPNLLVVTMHKAASTFVADVLLPSIAVRSSWFDLYNLGSELIEFARIDQAPSSHEAGTPSPLESRLERMLAIKPIPSSNMVVGRLYPKHLPAMKSILGWELPGEMNRMVVVRRDPRDALISLYWSLKKSHPANGIDPEHLEGFLETRERLGDMPVKDGVRWLLEPEGRGKIVLEEFTAITDMIRANPEITDLPYEDLIKSPRLWLSRFVSAGGFREIVDHNWHTEMLMNLRPPAAENPEIHKRRMRPGNWRDVFDGELHEMLEAILGDRMREFGYTRDMEYKGLRSAA